MNFWLKSSIFLGKWKILNTLFGENQIIFKLKKYANSTLEFYIRSTCNAFENSAELEKRLHKFILFL